MKDNKELKPIPKLLSDAEAEDFIETADLTEYDLSKLLLDAVKRKADEEGIPYQRFVRNTLEQRLRPDS